MRLRTPNKSETRLGERRMSPELPYQINKGVNPMARPAVRINTRVSADTNDWLDRKAEEMALSKSALVSIAVENWKKEIETVQNLPQLLKKLEEMGIDFKG